MATPLMRLECHFSIGTKKRSVRFVIYLIYDAIIQQTFGMHVQHLDHTRRF